jgi:hypothetical protein
MRGIPPPFTRLATAPQPQRGGRRLIFPGLSGASRGQSNGLRIHAFVFAVVSLAALLLIIAAVAIANPMA